MDIKNIIDNIIESATKYLISAIIGFLGLLIGTLFPTTFQKIFPTIVEKVPKAVLFQLLLVAIILFVLSLFLTLVIYLKYRTKLIPKCGVLWDKNKEAYCPACKTVLSEYSEQETPPIYEFRCINCNSDIRLSYYGKPISLNDAQKLITP